MSGVINSFIEKGTGPRRMRSALKSKIRPLGALLRATGVIGEVRAKAPKEIWGGDIFGVMSKQLREFLEGAEPPPAEGFTVPRGRSAFDESAMFLERKNPAFDSLSLLDKERENRFALTQATPQTRNEFSTTDASGDGSHDPFAARSIQTAATRITLTESTPNESGRHSFSDEINAKGRGRSRQPVASLLDKMVQRYWEANDSGRVSEKDSSRADETKTERPATAAGFAPAKFETRTARSWTEATGRQLSQKLRSLRSGDIAGDYSASAQQIVDSDSPEKVEIQNVFNIEVKTNAGGATGGEEELSEKISDILREQAIRHGIDVT